MAVEERVLASNAQALVQLQPTIVVKRINLLESPWRTYLYKLGFIFFDGLHKQNAVLRIVNFQKMDGLL
jgi:hypothetical protein